MTFLAQLRSLFSWSRTTVVKPQRLIWENDRPREELNRAGSPQVEISKPVPEAEDSKVTALSALGGNKWEREREGGRKFLSHT